MNQNQEKYLYDVAFSFLSEDEELATKINNLIIGRLNTYIYTENETPNGNTDGEKLLNDIFSSQARVVVVLYRQEWGNSGWTKIEQTAIRNRAFDEGYDFTIFIPLEKNPQLPKFVPKCNFWYGIDQWGIEGVAAVIEAKVQKIGGTLKQESAFDKALRLETELEAENFRKQFLNSSEGVKKANEEIELLYSEIKSLVETLTHNSKNFSFTVIHDKNLLVLSSNDISLKLLWNYRFNNTLEGACFYITIFQGFPRLEGRVPPLKEPTELSTTEFHFDLNSLGEEGWRAKNTKQFFTTGQFVEHCMKSFIEHIKENLHRDKDQPRITY